MTVRDPAAGGLSVEEIAGAETRASLILSVIPDSIPALQTLALCAMGRQSIQMREAVIDERDQVDRLAPGARTGYARGARNALTVLLNREEFRAALPTAPDGAMETPAHD